MSSHVTKKSTLGAGKLHSRRPSQHADMRRKNESVLLSLVRRFDGLSSADLARRSGLAPQTVSVLLRGLEKQGVIKRGGAVRGRRGQPAVPILLNPDGAYGVGVEIGWRHIDFLLLNLTGEVLSRLHHEVAYPDPATLVGDIVSGIENVLGVLSNSARKKVLGVGVAMPNMMSANLHTLGASPEEVIALEQLDLVSELDEKLNMKLVFANDGTSACRAECTYGRGAQYGDVVHIYISTYVGAGIYLDGRVIEGRSGDGATLGSFMVPGPDGEIRALHLIASVKALENLIVAAGKKVERSAPQDWDWSKLQPEVDAWLDQASSGLALAIANSCTVVDFSTAIIDGILPRNLLSSLVTMTQARIGKLPIATFEPPLVTLGYIGANAPAMGAANLPFYRSFFSQEYLGEKW